MIQCDSFDTARKIILDFFTVILNENDGSDEFGVPLPSEEARKRLNVLCSTHNVSDDYASDSDQGDVENGAIEKDLNFNADSGWIDDIIKEVSISKSENYHESVYFSGRDKEMYVKMLSSIALWSNIMNPIFGSSTLVATSSDVESYFKSLKTGIIGRKMLRVDDFFELHTDFVNAEIKLNAISNNKTVLNSPKPRGRSNSLHERSPITSGKLLRNSIQSNDRNNSDSNSNFHFTAKPKRSNSVHENSMQNNEFANASESGKLEIFTVFNNNAH